MNPITCIIVDDEPLAVKLLESFVQKTPQLQLEHSFTDSVEAFAWLKDHPVNLAFMDIQMQMSRQESRSSAGNSHADEPEGITQLSRP